MASPLFARLFVPHPLLPLRPAPQGVLSGGLLLTGGSRRAGANDQGQNGGRLALAPTSEGGGGMPEVSINYLAVVVAAVASMIIGAIWYSPRVFGRRWWRVTGKTMDQSAGQSGRRDYLVTFIGARVIPWGLALVLVFTDALS